MKSLINIKTGEAISQKTKKPYEYIEVIIGEYTHRLYPTRVEMIYIKSILKKQAHNDFKDGDEGEGDLDVDSDK